MLLRLKVNGFKNLMDVDVHFSPFTCVAGANGVGKSNLFDAIRFLSLLASKTHTEAALSVLAEGADEVFVNGDSFIRNAKALEPVFKARMFAEVQA